MRDLLARLWVEQYGWGRIWTGLAMAIALAGGGLIYQQVRDGGSRPPAPGEANVFVDGSGGSCQRHSPPIAYPNDGTECATLEEAYIAASLGDTVEIENGSYAGGDWSTALPKAGSNYVTFQPASGATVTITSDVTLQNQNHIRFSDFTINADLSFHLTDDVQLDNMSMQIWFSRGGKDITMTGGQIGPESDGTSPTVGKYAGERESQNIVFDGVLFDDINRSACPGCHVECLFIQSVTGVTIKNSKFQNCAVMDIFITPIGGTEGGGNQNADDITIENNWFGAPADGGSDALRIRPDPFTMANPNVRNNSFQLGGIISMDAATYTNAKMSGNVGYLGGACPPAGWTMTSNVWSDGDPTCGTGDTTSADFGYVDESGFDLHITSASPARNHGDAGNAPTVDIDNEARPQGTLDAGSDEIP